MSEQNVGRIRKDGGWDRRFGKRGTPNVIQALPVGPADTRIPMVRLANFYLATALLWIVIGAWFVTNFMERGAPS